MTITNLTGDKFDGFFEFNKKINSTQKNIVERLTRQIFDNPLLTGKSHPSILIALDEKDQIIGQHLHNPVEYFYRGECKTGFFGFDFFVEEAYRGQGIGFSLASAGNQKFFPHFGLGVSESSKKILLSLNNKVIGNFYIYIWIRNIFSLIRLALHSLLNDKLIPRKGEPNNFRFPNELSFNGCRFNLIRSLNHWEYHPWNEDILEFSRSLSFLNWRFLNGQGNYSLYLLDEPDATTYFVTRRIYSRGLNLLALVDYRLPFEDEEKFKLILQASKLLARKAHCDGVYTISTVQFFDACLKRSLFFKRPKPITILTNAGINFPRTKIEQRKCVLATMADSDMDYYFDFI